MKQPYEYDLSEIEQTIKDFSKKPLKDLRKRQDINHAQLRDSNNIKYPPKHAIDNLLVMQHILTQAVSLKVFGEYYLVDTSTICS
jgi:hypothetical protein